MPTTYDRVPDRFSAGETITWQPSGRALRGYWSDYPASSWDLTYRFAPAADAPNAMLTLTDGSGITENADGTYTCRIAPDAFNTLADGITYHFAAKVTDGTDTYFVDRGRCLVDKNVFALTGNVDLRSQLKKTIDALDTLIEGKASVDQVANAIGNRSVTRMSPMEIIKWRAYLWTRYTYEVDAERNRAGRPTSRRILTRFVR